MLGGNMEVEQSIKLCSDNVHSQWKLKFITTKGQTFRVKLYLPTHLRETEKIHKVFIFIPSPFDVSSALYNSLGRGLTLFGVSSILLPIDNQFSDPRFYEENAEDPFVPRDREAAKAAYDVFATSLYSDPIKLYRSFLNTRDNVETLTSFLASESEKNSSQFPGNRFDSSSSVSLLGYSIGGLYALGIFLGKDAKFSTSILLNSGPSLADIDVDRFLIKQEIHEFKRHLFESFNRLEEPIDPIFDQVVLGNDRPLLLNMLTTVVNRLLIIYGGTDAVFPPSAISNLTPHETGLALLQLPEIGHWISSRGTWKTWEDLIIRIIVDFEHSFGSFLKHV
jgi:hypothetical protein